MTKIEALQKTIYNLENDVYEYKWTDSDKCNCGVVARTILNGKKPSECGFHYTPKMDFELTCFANYAYCMTTNLPLPEVFKALKDTGFSHKELLELENLSNDAVCSRLGRKTIQYSRLYKIIEDNLRSDKPSVIQYLKAWVSILQEEEAITQPVQTPSIEAPAEQPKVIEKTVYVGIPISITEQAKELILS